MHINMQIWIADSWPSRSPGPKLCDIYLWGKHKGNYFTS